VPGNNSSQPEIVIPEDLTGPGTERLAQYFNVYQDSSLWQRPDELADLISGARALIVRNRTPVTAELLQAGRELLVVGRGGAGLDNIDVAAATKLGIVVGR